MVHSIPHDKDKEPGLTDAINNNIALLLQEVQVAKDAGNFEKAIEIIEKIIEMTEKSGLPSFTYQIEKEIISMRGNIEFSRLIPIYKRQLDYYREQNNLTQQIDTLHSLSAITSNIGDNEQALEYILEGEAILSTNKEIFSTFNSSEIGKSYYEMQFEEFQRVREYLEDILADRS